MAPNKRKRDNRASLDGSDNRPSPHRPGNSSLGRHDSRPDLRDGTGRRPSRGNQGNQGIYGGQGRGRREAGQDNSYSVAVSTTADSTPGPMSPPAPKPSSAVQTPTPIPTAEQPLSFVRPNPEPFDYEFLTEDRMAAWKAGGRQEVISLGISARSVQQIEDTVQLSTIFQELIRGALDGRLDPVDAGSCVNEIMGPDDGAEEEGATFTAAQDLFIDTLSMMADTEPGANELKTFPQALRVFTGSTRVSPVVLRSKLDGTLVQNLGLTRDTFIRVGIRQATHLLYRQANYNLLREETEGYSKLLTELFTTSDTQLPSADVVLETFEKIKGLIGAFDLDVGRVLDITMDVFASLLIKNHRFFIKLLRVSSWWPRAGDSDDTTATTRCCGLPKWALPSSPGWTTSDEDKVASYQERVIRDTKFWTRAREVGLDAFFELGGRETVDAETKQRLLSERVTDDELDADQQWIKETGTFPPPGNRTAAQLLGFKLRFYASPARDKEDVLPSNLIYLTALLIKIGFISLRDLYSHLWPLDEDMEQVRVAKLKELEDKERQNRPGGATNALMMAGALVDDTLPNGGRTRETTSSKGESTNKAAEVPAEDKPDEPADQKVQLLIHLLTIGALPEALFILGRFPWLPEAFPELLDLIHRILNYSIKDVYDTFRPQSTIEVGTPTKEMYSDDQKGVPKGQIRVTALAPRKLLRWPFPDKHDTNESSSYRFYWEDWTDNLPLCQCVDDVFTLCGTLLNYSGVNIGKDASLLSKLARIGAASLSYDRSQMNLDRWHDLLKRLLVPALSLTKANTSVVDEIYSMLRYYPVSIRFGIYAEWFEGQTSRLPAMKTAFARTRLETLSIMKRISTTNITSMAKSLSKAAFSSPGVVFSVALNQIEAYTNLTTVVVECAKYFTDLGYDVLVWSLMSSIGGKDRNRNNSEYSLLPSRWLLALSRFAGDVFKRYSNMNLSPVVKYVNDQLFRGNATDLVILKELMRQMAGIVPDTDFTDAQITAMTGGPLLRRYTLIGLQDKRYESVKTAKRLIGALIDNRLAGQLLISIAQHRQSAIYKIDEADAHIKVLATMIDDTQLILFQYLDLLRSNLSVEQFDDHIPDIPNLLIHFGLDPSLAFMIGRGSFSHKMANYDAPKLNGATVTMPPVALTDGEGDVSMDAEEQISTLSTKSEISGSAEIPLVISKENSPTPDSAHELLEPIISAVQELFPEGSWNHVTPEFYVTFWTTTLSDMGTPSKSYESELQRMVSEHNSVPRARTSDRAAVAKEEARKQAFEATKDALMAEAGKELVAQRLRKSRLLLRKSRWFEHSKKHDRLSEALFEKCLLPRLLLSPSDAEFTFKFIKFLHENATPNFQLLSLYSTLFATHRLRSLIFACTVREAENLGRFLRLVLADLARWHADAKIYKKEAWGPNEQYLGFSINDDGNARLVDYDAADMSSDGKKPGGFRGYLLMWHKGLNGAIRDCLSGTEWMHIRNAITILKTLVDFFPIVNFMGNGFIKQLEDVTRREKDVREDLSLTGNAVMVQLKKRQPKWVIVQTFGSNIAAQTNGAKAKSSSPSNVPTKSELKPTAPDFKPQAAEVEDGEVDDSKISSRVDRAEAKDPLANANIDTKAPAGPVSEGQPKSEVLARREQIKQANAAMSTSNGRIDPSRGPTSILPDHTLPTRPDAPLPPPYRGGHGLDRHPASRSQERRDNRDPRSLDTNRLDRPGERSRDFSADRRAMEPTSGAFTRPEDRGPGRERIRDPPPRWTPDSTQKNQEKQRTNDIRTSDSSGRLSRDLPPPRVAGPQGNRGPSLNHDRLPPVNPERAEIINPERAALITGATSPPRNDSPRRYRDDPRDRNSSRPQSPRRQGPDRDHGDSRRDDRSNRSEPNEPYATSRGHPDDNMPPPVGPRNDRATDRSGDKPMPLDRAQDMPSYPQQQPPVRQGDPSQSRGVNGWSQPADPNFGRLNPSSTPSSDIPLGPRDRNPRGNNRNSSAPQPRRDGRPAELPRPPTPEIPTGPSSSRHGQPHSRWPGSNQTHFDAPPPPSPISVTPSAASPLVHPSRLAHLGQAAAQTSQFVPPPPQSVPLTQLPPPIHPDRLKAFGNDAPAIPPPPSMHGSNSQTRPQPPILNTASTPSGPKITQSSPLPASSNNFGPPTGPASANANHDRQRPRRQLAGINNMLQQNSDNGNVKIRGRGANRTNSSNYGDSPMSAPPTPIIPPPHQGSPAARSEQVRGNVNPERADLITGNAGTPGEDRDRDRNGRRPHGSGRHSRRGSKSPSGNDRTPRESKRGVGEEGQIPREHNRRRDSGRMDGSERDRHQQRDPNRDMAGGREPSVGGNGRERDREHRDRHGRDREGGHEGGYAGNGERGGRSRNEDRRDRTSGGEDGSRKRHSEGGDGNERAGRDKRPRRT